MLAGSERSCGAQKPERLTEFAGRLQDARGDQCDRCGSMLNPTELIDPRCKVTGTKPILKPTKHLFLDLPKLTADLQAYIDHTSDLGGWSSNCLAVGHPSCANPRYLPAAFTSHGRFSRMNKPKLHRGHQY